MRELEIDIVELQVSADFTGAQGWFENLKSLPDGHTSFSFHWKTPQKDRSSSCMV